MFLLFSVAVPTAQPQSVWFERWPARVRSENELQRELKFPRYVVLVHSGHFAKQIRMGARLARRDSRWHGRIGNGKAPRLIPALF
jgi:hypothetical protein